MRKNFRFGFTFVELAIVLVIIGIIMGMAIKGRTLVHSTRTRSEIRKIEKLQVALSSYVTNHAGKIPPINDNTSDLLIKSEYLLERDRFSSFAEASVSGAEWRYRACSGDNSTGQGGFKAFGSQCVSGCESVCVTVVTTGDAAGATNILACYVENILDNKNVDTGNGRKRTGGSDITPVWANCEFTTGTSHYLFNIW